MKALLFDLFGTLIYLEKATRPYFQAYREHFSTYLSFEEFSRAVMTSNYESIGDFGKSLDIPSAALQTFNQTVTAEIDSVQLYAETREVLRHFSERLPLYALSNLATPYVQAYEKAGLGQWITQPFFSCQMGWMKPDAEAYQYVVDQIGVSPEDVLMVGDSYRSDYQGARSAGLRSVWLDRKGREGDGVITDLTGLYALVKG